MYFLLIKTYGFLLKIAALFYPKAALWANGRKNWRETLLLKTQKLATNEHRFWVHAASLGEFEQGLPVIQGLKKQYPNCQIILSFFSPSGFEAKKNDPVADLVCYLPLDTPKNAQDFIGLINPTAAFFIKYELWACHFAELKKKNVPLVLFSAIFNENKWLFSPLFSSFTKKTLNLATKILVQDNESVEILRKLGILQVAQCPDTRFDRVCEVANTSFEHAFIEQFIKNKTVVVAGSTWQPDEELLYKTMQKLPQNFVLILAPHEINGLHISNLQKNAPYKTLLLSENELAPDARILIVNSVGLLRYLYRFGKYAYIGGGFGAGIHNTLEAAAYGKPVFFGPKNQNFNEAQKLKKIHQPSEIKNSADLCQAILELEGNSALYTQTSADILAFTRQNVGGTQQVIEVFKNI